MTDSPGGNAFDVRHPWFVGGVLLLATVVIGVALQPPLVLFGGVLGTVLFSASLLVFALGIRGVGSVTARRPLGTVALVLLAAWILIQSVLTDVLSADMSADAIPTALIVVGYVDPYLRFALALIAVIQIGRAQVVPSPWNWAPAWAVAALSVPWVLGQILAVVGTSPESEMAALMAIAAVDALIRVGSAVFLGVVAIVLADRSGRTAGSGDRSGDSSVPNAGFQ